MKINNKLIDNGKILWTNPKPTANFEAQTINVNLSEYDAYEVLYSVSNTLFAVKSTGIIPKSQKGAMVDVYYQNGVIIRRRTITSVNNNSITFSVSTTNATVSNDIILPLYIIGHNTNLFN